MQPVSKININVKWEVVSFLISVCTLVTCSVFDDEDHRYPLEAKYKIKFKKEDTLLYIDQNGSQFRLKVVDVVSWDRVTSRKGSGGPYDIVENQRVDYDSLIKNLNFPAPFALATTDQPSGNLIWRPDFNDRLTSSTIFHSVKLINQTTYEDVYELNSNSNSQNVVKWYYTYWYGFVGFQLQNGQIFSLTIP